MANEEEIFVKTVKGTEHLVAGIPGEKRYPVMPIASTLAKIITRSNWNPEDFALRLECGCIMFKAGKSEEVNISGYNFAYQIKLCLDAIEKAGYFE